MVTATADNARYGYPSSGGRGDRYANGKKIEWPLCDFCGKSMVQVSSEAYIARFECTEDHFQLSFASCRHSDRYCAWERLLDADRD